MIRKNYYVILGVPHGETTRGIQAAFRELAKRYHPDRAGPDATAKFQDIREAYDVLSDPEKRRRYNDELEREHAAVRTRPEPIYSRPYPRPEPLIPERRSVLRDFQTIRPSFDALFERIARNFTGHGIPKAERLESLNVEVLLSPDEAAWGTEIPVGVPVLYSCPDCHGFGHVALFPCIECEGQGFVEDEETVTIRIPPITADRAVFEIPIEGLGISNLYLRLFTRVAS
jgi:DnaJ-class molecular chaperone